MDQQIRATVSWKVRKFRFFHISNRIKNITSDYFFILNDSYFGHLFFSLILLLFFCSDRLLWESLWKELPNYLIDTPNLSAFAKIRTRTSPSFWELDNLWPPSFPCITLISALSVSSWKVTSGNVTWQVNWRPIFRLDETIRKRSWWEERYSSSRGFILSKSQGEHFLSNMFNFFVEYLILDPILK